MTEAELVAEIERENRDESDLTSDAVADRPAEDAETDFARGVERIESKGPTEAELVAEINGSGDAA